MSHRMCHVGNWKGGGVRGGGRVRQGKSTSLCPNLPTRIVGRLAGLRTEFTVPVGSYSPVCDPSS